MLFTAIEDICSSDLVCDFTYSDMDREGPSGRAALPSSSSMQWSASLALFSTWTGDNVL